MTPELSNDKTSIHEILAATQLLAKKYLDKQDDLPPGRFVNDVALERLPRQGMGAKATLNYFETNFADKINNSAGPRYFGFVTGGSTPAALAGDWLVSSYDQNACGSNDSIAPQIERQTIQFFKEMFRLDSSYFGTFVTGATISNFTSLALGRQWIGEQHNIDFSTEGLCSSKPIKVISGTPHSSIIKSLSMLGLGRKAMIRIDTLPDREAVDVQALENYLRENREPVIVVANAGTVNTVDFDDLDAIAKLKSKYNFWLHVDAAFGGFAACSEKYDHYLKGINHAGQRHDRCSQVAQCSVRCSYAIHTTQRFAAQVFQNSAAYLGDPGKSPDFFHYTPENSRRFRALPSWFTLMAYGSEGYREIVERNCRGANLLGELIQGSENFRLPGTGSHERCLFHFG
jgi:glutamate/tyrosine decarboxylase-like PLP-dependent enzyme